MNRKIIRTAVRLFCLTLLINVACAPQTIAPTTAKESQEDRIALYQALLDLTNPWTVMCIAAHPDDEDGTSLIVMRRKYGAHTVSVFSTFGEGGQNAIGPELYEELGAIRARETMAAAEIQGSEPYFLGLKDFGYSKSADEAFRVWGHDEALRRMVLQIRKLRPDVIITNHSVTNNDHGHHQATARLELEAFDAAADPKRFPEQLKDSVTAWQVQRLFVRVGRSNQPQAETSPVVTIDPNERDPVRGVVYAEEALRALQKHATQGPWPKTFAEFTARFRAFSGQGGATGQMPLIRYALVREAKGADALAKDSHNFLDGLRLPEQSAKQLTPPTIDGKPLTNVIDDRERILHTLITAARDKIFGAEVTTTELNAVPADSRRSRMVVRLYTAIAAAAGIKAAIARGEQLVQGESTARQFVLTNNCNQQARVRSVNWGARNDKGAVVLGSHKNVDSNLAASNTMTLPLTFQVSMNEAVTVPHATHLYELDFAGKPIVAAALIELNGATFRISAGALADVLPRVEMRYSHPTPIVVSPKTETDGKLLDLTLINNTSLEMRGSLQALVGANSPGEYRVIAEMPEEIKPDTNNSILWRSLELSKIVQQLNVQGFSARSPHANLLVRMTGPKPVPEVSVPFVYANARTAQGLYVGYIRGFDYSLLQALDALGVPSKELSVNEVKSADLSKFTSIIVDNRVYESQTELIAANQKLLDYAKDGGTLIVFYHKSNEWNPDPRRSRPQLAPYPLTLGDERITDENAPVTFIEPQHPLLNLPNKIGPEDFAGWIQERGLYYPKEWDGIYHALLQSNDPGEAPLRGGLLVADYGRGHYIYTSMVWYRQLRAGVPGAYRMLANMISYGHTAK